MFIYLLETSEAIFLIGLELRISDCVLRRGLVAALLAKLGETVETISAFGFCGVYINFISELIFSCWTTCLSK